MGRSVISEPLQGEDAERLVAYIENPVPPAGHDEFLAEADRVYAEINEAPHVPDLK